MERIRPSRTAAKETSMTSPEADRGFELGTDGPRAVLVGIDGSRTSLRAAAYALGQARRADAELVGVYVANPSSIAASTPGGAEAVELAHEEGVAEVSAHIRDRAGELGVRYRFFATRGDTAREIARIADDTRVDAVVVGASESFGHRFAGSLAVRLIRSARWPVTVIP